jgi:hypothetical protein
MRTKHLPSARILGLLALLAAASSCSRSHGAGPGDAGASEAAVGVPECDDYLSKYARCIADKVPADRRESFHDALARTRTSWIALAANPGARPGLPQACSLALQTARTTLKQYACAW